MVRMCSNGNLTWRCTTRGRSSRLHTDKDVEKIVKYGGAHKHVPTSGKSRGTTPQAKRRAPPDVTADAANADADALPSDKPEAIVYFSNEPGGAGNDIDTAVDMLQGQYTLANLPAADVTEALPELGGGETREIVVEIKQISEDEPLDDAPLDDAPPDIGLKTE